MAAPSSETQSSSATGEAGGPPAGPLTGIVVVDLSRVLAGPYCSMVLSDLGARVIKVEIPGQGDDARTYGPFVDGRSAYFASINRGKESIALDLKSADDRAIFDRLLERADVVMENFRAGTMERLGYGWTFLHERYPRLIYAATSGFGHTGPYRERPAYDMVVQGMGGIMSLTGQPGGEPTRVGTSVGDITAGLFTAIGINAALYHRAATGEGMMVDVAMLDSQVAILENAIARYFATGVTPGPLGTRHPSITPFEAFETGDGWLIIAAGNNQLFRRLAQALDSPALAEDARFVDNDARTAHADDLKAALEVILKTADTAHWLAVLSDAGVPASPINTVADTLTDRQVLARNMVVGLGDDRPGGDCLHPVLKVAGNPIKLSAFADPDRRGPPPELDGDRQAILAWLDSGA
ncbi:MAG: CaiB/BaiF CoA-transferase family protein [Azospirillaceae bacterium]